MKLAVIGKGVVGKSSLTYRFINYKLPQGHDPTIEDRYKTSTTINNQLYSIEILDTADIVVAMTTQKAENITNLLNTIAEGTILKRTNTIITLGRYDDKSKYNAKNISRSILKTKEIINTVPYNTVLFEDIQEGKIIDMFIRFLELKTKDENTFFIDEIKRLKDNIDQTEEILQQMRK